MTLDVSPTFADEPPKPPLVAVATGIPGLLLLRPPVLKDSRGDFTKIFHQPLWKDHGLVTDFKEEYCTRSSRGVIRGLHFQLPPMQHAKVVYCIEGSILDVVLDLRAGSPTFQQHLSFELSPDSDCLLYIPEGLAHGFCALSDQVTMYYKVSTVYSPQHDAGILWSSIGFSWPVESPILSARDGGFPSLDDFSIPFVFPDGGAMLS